MKFLEISSSFEFSMVFTCFSGCIQVFWWDSLRFRQVSNNPLYSRIQLAVFYQFRSVFSKNLRQILRQTQFQSKKHSKQIQIKSKNHSENDASYLIIIFRSAPHFHSISHIISILNTLSIIKIYKKFNSNASWYLIFEVFFCWFIFSVTVLYQFLVIVLVFWESTNQREDTWILGSDWLDFPESKTMEKLWFSWSFLGIFWTPQLPKKRKTKENF